jgi:anti-sigma regulatory factor (Ser/Thr protein kinase)
VPDRAWNLSRDELSLVCVNIVVHAYEVAAQGRLDVVLSNDGVELVAHLRDRGRAFDPATVKPPELEQGQVHGYGIPWRMRCSTRSATRAATASITGA